MKTTNKYPELEVVGNVMTWQNKQQQTPKTLLS